MSQYQDVYIHTPSTNEFKHHLSREERLTFPDENFWGYEKTLCDIYLDWRSDTGDTAPSAHFEHERDDVIECLRCRDKFIQLFLDTKY